MFSNDPYPTVDFNLKECVVFPVGHKCSSALAAISAGVRLFSLPFDWCGTLFPKKVISVFSNDFVDFVPDTFDNLLKHDLFGDYYINKYDIRISHIDKNKGDDTILTYKRRIDRAMEILNGTQPVCFLYINEGYLWDKKFRKDGFNKQIFEELLELDRFIASKYPQLKYKILFIDFVKHTVPAESNIIPIVVHSTKLTNVHIFEDVTAFREYCGKMLKDIIPRCEKPPAL
jgi:hypothetical protein